MWRGTLNYVLWNHNQNRWPSCVGFSRKQNISFPEGNRTSIQAPVSTMQVATTTAVGLNWLESFNAAEVKALVFSSHRKWQQFNYHSSTLTDTIKPRIDHRRGQKPPRLATQNSQTLVGFHFSLHSFSTRVFLILNGTSRHSRISEWGHLVCWETFTMLKKSGKRQLATLIKMISALIAGLSIKIAFLGVFH